MLGRFLQRYRKSRAAEVLKLERFSDLRDRLCEAIPGLVREVVSDDFRTDGKGGDGLDFVTSVDLELQARLREFLSGLLPGSEVTGEEGYSEAVSDGPVWLVDPLDGTVNFVAGLPSAAVAVALIDDGRCQLAAIHDIFHRQTYAATLGGGAVLDGSPLRPRQHPARLAALSSGTLQDLAARSPGTLGALLDRFKLRNFGSQALHLCHAAAGRLALVANREAKGWDDMAGALIARECGLRFGHYGLDNAPTIDAEQFSLCCPPEVFDTCRDLLRRSVAPPKT